MISIRCCLGSAIFAVCAVLAGGPASASASFDCSKASTLVEKTICSDAALAELDSKLAKTYADKSHQLNASAADSLRTAQRKWLTQRGAECSISGKGDEVTPGATACLTRLYQGRIAEISAGGIKQAAADQGQKTSKKKDRVCERDDAHTLQQMIESGVLASDHIPSDVSFKNIHKKYDQRNETNAYFWPVIDKKRMYATLGCPIVCDGQIVSVGEARTSDGMVWLVMWDGGGESLLYVDKNDFAPAK